MGLTTKFITNQVYYQQSIHAAIAHDRANHSPRCRGGVFTAQLCYCYNIIIGNIYKPPKNNNNNDNIQQFMNELDPVLTKLDSDNKHILLAGNSNINLLKINERELFADFLEQLTHHSFYPKITLPTRFSMYSCSLIDNVFL